MDRVLMVPTDRQQSTDKQADGQQSTDKQADGQQSTDKQTDGQQSTDKQTDGAKQIGGRTTYRDQKISTDGMANAGNDSDGFPTYAGRGTRFGAINFTVLGASYDS
jgi:hypothetical protein